MRANVMKLWVAIGAVAVISGCRCDPGDCSTDVFVTFDSPTDGQANLDPTIPVSVSVKDGSGTAIELDSAQLVTKAGNGSFSVPKDGVKTAGKATFANVSLEPGDNTLKVTVKQKATACTANKSITVKVKANPMTDKPVVLMMLFPQDTAMPIGTLNSVELPTTASLRVDLTTQFAIGGTVEIINQANNMPLAPPTPITDSAVTVLIPSAALTDGGYMLFAKITKAALTNDPATNPEAVKALTLARTPPTCAVVLPMKAVVGPNDDADSVPGYQLRASGTGSATSASIELTLSGGATPQTSGEKPLVSGGNSSDFTIPATGSTTYTVTVIARDAQGNECRSTKMVTVDFEPPVCSITSPTAAGSPYAAYNIPLSATSVGGNGGTVAFSTDLPQVRDLSSPLAVTNGVSPAYTGSFTAGAQVVTAVCTDAAGNSSTATQAITVNGAGCSVYFVRPFTKPALITTATYSVLAQTSCPGQVVTLKQTGVANKTATAAATGLASFSLTALVNGTFTLTAEVGTPVSSDQVDVTVDLNAPVITRPFLSPGKTYALLNVAADLAPATAGAQSLLTYTATVPTGGRVDVCTNQIPAAPGGPCVDGASGWSTLKASVAASEPMFTFPEGTYSLKVVVAVGTVAQAVSAPIEIVSDVTAPTLTMVRFVRDTNGDKALNITEIAGQPLQIAFDVGASNPASTIGLVEIRDTLTYNKPASVMSAGQSFTVTLDQNLTAPVESDFNWVIDVTDVNENKASTPFSGLRIDQVAPTCAMSQPSAVLLGQADDSAPGTPGYQLQQSVTTSPDVLAPDVTIAGGQSGTFAPVAAGGVATQTWTLTQATGTVLTYNFTASCRDKAGNVTVASPKNGVVVDLDPPTCTINTPVASPPQYLNFAVATSITVTGAAAPQSVRVYSQPTAGAKVLRANLPISGTAAAGSVSYVGGVQAVTAEVDDLANNTGTCGPVSINVNGTGCDIAFTSPVLTNGKAFLTAAPFTVTGQSSNCGAGNTVRLFRVVGAVTTLLGSGVTNPSGAVSIMGTLVDGGPYTLRLEIDNGGGVLNVTDLAPVTVDTIAPTVGSASPTGATLTFVAATNSNLPGAAYVADLTAGGNADFTVTLNNVVGALDGTVKVFFKGVQVGATVDVTADPQAVVTFNTSLPHNDSGTFEIRVSDEAGNVIKPTVAAATIDVIAPSAPTVTPTRTDARAATMSLSWAPTYDDGSAAASGANAGYDIRWTTDAVTGANQLATSADYFNSARGNPESIEPWSSSTINRVITLPPFNTYYIAVRARDEVGNYSAYVAPTAFDNQGTKDGLVNPTGVGAQSFGRLLASNGSLNGDAFDDIVTASTTAGTVYVYFGRSAFGALTTCAAPNCQAIGLPVTSVGDTTFGSDFSVGNVGDTAAPDLLVSSPNFTTNTGRAFLFFGGASPIDTTSFIEFRGPTTGIFFGRTAQIIPDINKDGIGEIAIMSNENAGRARVYIYKGRSKAAWQAAAAGGFVPTSQADAVIEGPSPITGNTFFGFARGGFTSLGDLNGDGNLDFSIPDPKDNINKLYIFSGLTVTNATLATPLTTGTSPGIPSNTLQELTTTGTGTGSSSGFSVRAIGGVDFMGASGNDLFVSQPQQQRVLLFGDISLPILSQTLTITGTNNFGAGGALGKFRSTATTELVISENSALATSNAWVFYARQGSFDTAAGVGFWQSIITGPASGTTGVFGSSVATGDFDNDGKPDMAFSDPSTSFGRILVWH